MLDRITPLVLTYNEEANLPRLLAALDWAGRIVVVDSFSTDRTAEILRAHPRVEMFERKFDSHAKQWSYGLDETGISTEWVLALDADYIVTPESLEELRKLDPDERVSGYRAGFRYCINGRPLWGSLYPPVTVLYRKKRASYVQDGHTQRAVIEGSVESLQQRLWHDDRKSLSRWLKSQDGYSDQEADKILGTSFAELPWSGRVRKLLVLAAPAAVVSTLILNGGIFQGTAGLYYAMQRTLAEILITLKMLDRTLFRR